MWGPVIALAAGLVGYLARSIVEWVRARHAKSHARLARLEELADVLQESKEAFRSQIGMAGRLIDLLAADHAADMPDASLGYNRTFAHFYPSFTDAERDLFLVIRGLTRGTVRDTNTRMSEWLRENADVLRLEDPFVGPELAELLRSLRQHLSEWHALFLATRDDDRRSLVFLADEFQTGTGFPTGIEDLVDNAVRRARGSQRRALLTSTS